LHFVFIFLGFNALFFLSHLFFIPVSLFLKAQILAG